MVEAYHNTKLSAWSGEFVDRDLERLYWHETWSGWSKIVGYAGLIFGVVLALMIMPQEDYRKLGFSTDFVILLAARSLTALCFIYGAILAFSSTHRVRRLQTWTFLAFASGTLMMSLVIIIHDGATVQSTAIYLGTLVTIYIIIPNPIIFRLANGALFFVSTVTASYYVTSTIDRQFVVLLLVCAGGNAIGVLGSAWQAKKLRKDFLSSSEAGQASDRLLAERAASESDLRSILDNMEDTFYRLDLDGAFTMVSPSVTEFAGYRPNELIGRNVRDFYINEAEFDDLRTELQAKGGRLRNVQGRIRGKDGREIWTSTSAHYRYDDAGNILGTEGITRDVTERRREQLAMTESSSREREALQLLEDALASITEGFVLYDADDRLVVSNSRFRELYKKSAPAIKPGNTFEDMIRFGLDNGEYAEAAGREEAWFKERMRQHRDPGEPFEQQCADGLWLRVEERRTSSGGIVGIRTDITELKQRGQALQESEERFHSISQSSSNVMIVAVDHDGLIVSWNPAAEKAFGYSEAEILERPLTDIMPERYKAAHRRGFLRAAKTDEYQIMGKSIEVNGLRKNGEEFQIELSLGTWQQGEAKYFSAIIHDITERKQLEEQVRRSQKMEAIGQLTGGVAHDFNNILAAIIGNLNLIEDGRNGDGLDKENVATALRAALRGAELTHRLLAFSRQQELDAKATRINDLLPQFAQLAQRTIGADVTIEMNLVADLWPTMVDAGQLENALLNLVINARHAMPDGGRLTIETANQTLQEGDAAISEDLSPGDYVMIAVSDSGTGMPAAVRSLAFEPFFTTKDVGQGSGLGLSMVFGFAKQSGGHVSIYSEEGEGTTVKIYLPRSGETEEIETTSKTLREDRPTGDETILVVEDDKDVRDYLVIVLGRLGYTVLEAEDGPAALKIMTVSGPIDLLLTDVILPRGMSGSDVASAFREQYPAAGVVFSSGYTREVLNHRGQIEDGMMLMNKPYQTQALAQRVREALDGRIAGNGA